MKPKATAGRTYQEVASSIWTVARTAPAASTIKSPSRATIRGRDQNSVRKRAR